MMTGFFGMPRILEKALIGAVVGEIATSSRVPQVLPYQGEIASAVVAGVPGVAGFVGKKAVLG